MWSLGKSQEKTTQDLNRGIGLAMLSRVLGVKKIEDNLETFKEQIRKSLTLNLDVRLKVQRRVREDLEIIGNEMELEVTKKYHVSKKTVYGIDNELHLVEQV